MKRLRNPKLVRLIEALHAAEAAWRLADEAVHAAEDARKRANDRLDDARNDIINEFDDYPDRVFVFRGKAYFMKQAESRDGLRVEPITILEGGEKGVRP